MRPTWPNQCQSRNSSTERCPFLLCLYPTALKCWSWKTWYNKTHFEQCQNNSPDIQFRRRSCWVQLPDQNVRYDSEQEEVDLLSNKQHCGCILVHSYPPSSSWTWWGQVVHSCWQCHWDGVNTPLIPASQGTWIQIHFITTTPHYQSNICINWMIQHVHPTLCMVTMSAIPVIDIIITKQIWNCISISYLFRMW